MLLLSQLSVSLVVPWGQTEKAATVEEVAALFEGHD
jgi:hypothetical protein